MSYPYERSKKTLNEDYYASDPKFSDSYRANTNYPQPSQAAYSGGPYFSSTDPSYARPDPEEALMASQGLLPVREPSYTRSYHQPNYNKQARRHPSTVYANRGPVDFGNGSATLLGRSKDEIFGDLSRVINGSRKKQESRDNTPALMSDYDSPPSTPSVASPPAWRDPSPPSHIEPQAYPQQYYGYGQKNHDSSGNALAYTHHTGIDPSKSATTAHYPPKVQSSSFAKTESSYPYNTGSEHYPAMDSEAKKKSAPKTRINPAFKPGY